MSTATATYFRNRIESATPAQRVVMLYDGAVTFAENAARCMAERDYENATVYNIRAQSVIMELQNSLNLQEGGDLAARLYGLYSYFLKRLMKANLARNPEMINVVMCNLKELREAWEQIEAGVGAEVK
jgi:flagellar protein FliS